MPNPIIRIHNATTNEVIDREMTDEEYAEFLNPTISKSPWDEA